MGFVRYFSDFAELNGKAFESEKEMAQAEAEILVKREEKRKAEEAKKQKAAEREKGRVADAAKIDELYKVAMEDEKKAEESVRAWRKAVSDFASKYGSYHFSFKSDEELPHINDFVSAFWNMFA